MSSERGDDRDQGDRDDNDRDDSDRDDNDRDDDDDASPAEFIDKPSNLPGDHDKPGPPEKA
jgi:hypothetical protein